MPMILSVELSSKAPCPFALPHQRDLNRLWNSVDFSAHSGRRYRESWGKVRISVKDDRDSPSGLTDFFETVPFPIVSEKFAQLLTAFRADCEFLPLEISYRRTLIVDQYFALNVIACSPSAVNREESRFSCYFPDVLEEVESLTLIEGALGQECIAYLPEIGRLAVNDALAKALSQSGLRGFVLTAQEKFTG